MLRNLTAFCFLLSGLFARGQMRAPDSTLYDQAIANATTTFRQAVALQKEIYTGPEHLGYPSVFEGTPYFAVADWQPGSVQYDGIWYPDQLLKYDAVADKLVLRRFDGFAIELRSDKTDYFTVPGHTIVYWNGGTKSNLRPGFYEQLATGPLTILARHTKVPDEHIENNKLHQTFRASTAYYAVKEGQVHTIRNLGAVLDLAGPKRSAMQQYLRKQGLRFKRNPEATLAAAAAFYNNLQP